MKKIIPVSFGYFLFYTACFYGFILGLLLVVYVDGQEFQPEFQTAFKFINNTIAIVLLMAFFLAGFLAKGLKETLVKMIISIFYSFISIYFNNQCIAAFINRQNEDTLTNLLETPVKITITFFIVLFILSVIEEILSSIKERKNSIVAPEKQQ